VGSFWSFHWVGGSLGRHVWLAWCALGFALLAKKRFFGGGAALAVAGLLRLFPFGFLGGAILWAIVKSIKERRLDADGKRLVAGAAIAFTLGNALTVAAVGTHRYHDFAHVFDRHSHSRRGISSATTLLAWERQEMPLTRLRAEQLDAPPASAAHRTTAHLGRRDARCSGVVAALPPPGCLGGVRRPIGARSVSVCPMTSYDYTWLVVRRARRSSAEDPASPLGFAVFRMSSSCSAVTTDARPAHPRFRRVLGAPRVAADVPGLYRRFVGSAKSLEFGIAMTRQTRSVFRQRHMRYDRTRLLRTALGYSGTPASERSGRRGQLDDRSRQ
jgi:hypothetical protein